MTRLPDRELLRLAADERLPADVRAALAAQFYEAPFERQILEEAERQGWEPYHTQFSKRSRKGFPDLVLVRPPRLVFAENKRIGGRYTPEQRKWLALLHRCPQVEVYEWDPSNWAEIEEVLA